MTQDHADRFIDDGHRLAHFADRVMVRCSRCGTPGIVQAPDADRARVTFRCGGCGFSLSRANDDPGGDDRGGDDWVGPVVITGHRACGHCGHHIRVSRSHPSRPGSVPKTLQAACPQCRRTQEITVTMLPSWPADRCIDPHFGLALQLSAATRQGVIWAYNERHLAALQAYVAAQLRVRRGGGNGAMFSRYPAWIKAAKNRDLVLKALSRLEAKLAAG